MATRTGWTCAWLAALTGVLVYGLWPAPEPAARAGGTVAGGDNYFTFVKATAFAPAADVDRAGRTVAMHGGEQATPPAAGDPAQSLSARLLAVETAVQALRRQGADEQAVYRLRADALPAATAAQLAEREQSEQDWQRRVQAYRAERERLAASTNPVADGDADHQAAQARLRADRFAPDEQAQLEASLPPTQPMLRQD